MDQGASGRVAAALLGVSLAASCHWLEFRTISADGISCEVPRHWQESSGDGSLFVHGPDEVREVGVFISVHPDRPRTRVEIEAAIQDAKRTFRDDSNYTSHPLVEVPVGGTLGYVIGDNDPIRLSRDGLFACISMGFPRAPFCEQRWAGARV